MGDRLPVPDHGTLARRRRGPMSIVLDSAGLEFHGPGERSRAWHGEKRRSSGKLHVAIDPERGGIVAHELTDDDMSGATRAGASVARSGGRIRTVFVDGATHGPLSARRDRRSRRLRP